MVLYPNKLPESERVCFGICRRVNEERIDWNELTAIGITREQLKASGNLEKMLGWERVI